MWLVTLAFTLILIFVRNNGAAEFTINHKWYLIPLNLLYFVMLLLGINKDFGAFCESYTYPWIFTYQYGVFFLTYLIYLFVHSKNFFIKWDEQALEPATVKQLATTQMINHSVRRRSEARMIFELQADKLRRYFTQLICLSVFCVSVPSLLVYYKGIDCTEDGSHWLFENCTIRNIVFFFL